MKHQKCYLHIGLEFMARMSRRERKKRETRGKIRRLEPGPTQIFMGKKYLKVVHTISRHKENILHLLINIFFFFSEMKCLLVSFFQSHIHTRNNQINFAKSQLRKRFIHSIWMRINFFQGHTHRIKGKFTQNTTSFFQDTLIEGVHSQKTRG